MGSAFKLISTQNNKPIDDSKPMIVFPFRSLHNQPTFLGFFHIFRDNKLWVYRFGYGFPLAICIYRQHISSHCDVWVHKFGSVITFHCIVRVRPIEGAFITHSRYHNQVQTITFERFYTLTWKSFGAVLGGHFPKCWWMRGFVKLGWELMNNVDCSIVTERNTNWIK